jgi:predicted ATP-binding protein involved in virulence
MILKKLQLKNFRSFNDIEIAFHDKLSVIVGVNGAGKTSIMEGVAIAISSMFVKMDGLTARKINKDQAHLKTYTVGSTKDVQAQYPVIVSAEASCSIDGDESSVIHWSRSLNSSSGQTLFSEAKEITSLGTQYQNQVRSGDDSLVLPVLAYYGTGRLWDYHREKQSDLFQSNSRLNGYVDCMDGTANIKLMMSWFSKMTILKYQNQDLGLEGIPELEAVYSAMETCFKRITGCDTVKIQYNMGTKELEVAYEDESGEMMRIPINQLSDGYKSTISLVADIAYRMAVLNPQFLGDVCNETDGIVVIDEVDLHLHPSWQQRILGDLTAIFPKVQFIVSTHAPEVINSVPKENVIIMKQGVAFSAAVETYGKDANGILHTIMEVNARPHVVAEKIEQFHTCIDNQKYDDADAILSELENTLDDDPEIVSMRVELDFERL